MYPKQIIETYRLQIKAIQWKSVNIRAKSKVSKNITESIRMTGNAHTSHEIYRNLWKSKKSRKIIKTTTNLRTSNKNDQLINKTNNIQEIRFSSRFQGQDLF